MTNHGTPDPAESEPNYDTPEQVWQAVEDGRLPDGRFVSIVGSADDDRVRVYSDIHSVSRRLARHPLFDTETRRMRGNSLSGITGTLPIDVLYVRPESKAHKPKWHKVVTDAHL